MTITFYDTEYRTAGIEALIAVLGRPKHLAQAWYNDEILKVGIDDTGVIAIYFKDQTVESWSIRSTVKYQILTPRQPV